jgi:hypothetical protein
VCVCVCVERIIVFMSSVCVSVCECVCMAKPLHEKKQTAINVIKVCAGINQWVFVLWVVMVMTTFLYIYTHIYIHTQTHFTYKYKYTHSLSLFHTHTNTNTHTLSLSLSHTHTHTHIAPHHRRSGRWRNLPAGIRRHYSLPDHPQPESTELGQHIQRAGRHERPI